MVNETILGGLRVAVSHKSSLKDAMQSFYNSGYNKEEVEEAAKIIFDEQVKKPKPLSPEDLKKTIQELYQAGYKKEGIQKTTEELSQIKKAQEGKNIQTPTTSKVQPIPEIKKTYSKKKIGLIILLVGILIILLSALIGIFIFKDKIF